MTYWQRIVLAIAALALAQVIGNSAAADEEPLGGMRADVSLDLPVWPALNDLQTTEPGSFDSTGFGIGASGHWPVALYANSELLLGVDISIAATDSSISGFWGDLFARQMYLGGSVKWMFGESRNVSVDAGIGYHELDMAQINTQWWGTMEYEQFSKSTASSFVGMTWDIGAGRPEKDSGLSLGFRVHFTDFGRVGDEDGAPTVLGADAGQLDGPMYVARIGYSVR